MNEARWTDRPHAGGFFDTNKWTRTFDPMAILSGMGAPLPEWRALLDTVGKGETYKGDRITGFVAGVVLWVAPSSDPNGARLGISVSCLESWISTMQGEVTHDDLAAEHAAALAAYDAARARLYAATDALSAHNIKRRCEDHKS